MPTVAHFLFSLLACLGLFFLWRKVAAADRFHRAIVTAGLLVRVIAAQILFWISYLGLRPGRSLQLDGGLWFFAADAQLYIGEASRAMQKGWGGILLLPRSAPSASFVQVLAAAMQLFGAVASVAILINAFCYLGCCYVISKWSAASKTSRMPAAIALAAVTLSPSGVLWSTQPLKDGLFTFIAVGFLAGCARWQNEWRAGAQWKATLPTAAILLASMYVLAGIRWYFAFFVLIATAAFFLLVILATRTQRLKAAVISVVLLVLLSQVFVFSAFPYIPGEIRDVLNPVTAPHALVTFLPRAAGDVERVRNGFDRTRGATTIALGARLARVDRSPALASQRSEQASHPASTAVPKRANPHVAMPPGDAGRATSGERAVADTTPVSPAPQKIGLAPAADATPEQPMTSATSDAAASTPSVSDGETTALSTNDASPAAPAAVPQPLQPDRKVAGVAGDGESAALPPSNAHGQTSSIGRETPSTRTVPPLPSASVTSAPAQRPTAGVTQLPSASRKIERTRAKTKESTAPSSQATSSTPSNPPAAAPAKANPLPPRHPAVRQAGDGEGRDATAAIHLPSTPLARLLAGATVAVLPYGLGRRLGLVEMSGGRSFWWFADLDTLVFDLMLIVAGAVFLKYARRYWRSNPAFWLIMLLLALVSGPLLYTVSNFGTLFRLRAMIYLVSAFIPLALAPAFSRVSDPLQSSDDQ